MSWRGVAIAAGILLAVVGVCVLNLRCSGDPEQGSTVRHVNDELAAWGRERRIQEADNLARMAHDLRVMARHYVTQGEKAKAQRAIGAAQELDKRIQALRGAASD